MEWSPIVDGTRATQLRAVLEDITNELANVDPPDAGLFGGAAGMAVYFAYLARATDDVTAFERASALLERATAMLGDNGSSLSTGLAGIGWAIEHLAGDPDADIDANDAIDGALSEVLAGGWNGDYDLVSGLVGFSVYALARVRRPAARTILEQIVAELERRGDAEGGFHTAPELLAPQQRELAPDGYYNLGLAHGVCGVIAMLANVVRAGIATGRAQHLLSRTVSALQAYRVAGSYPAWRTGSDARIRRTGWCYGDPGVACALISAGRAIGESAWEYEAIELMRGVARRAEEIAIDDGCLCHGAFGNALMLDRFFHATGDDAFRRAALVFVDRALALRRSGSAIAGYPFQGASGEWKPDPGILVGAAGVGLAVLALTTDVEPRWDRALLLP